MAQAEAWWRRREGGAREVEEENREVRRETAERDDVKDI